MFLSHFLVTFVRVYEDPPLAATAALAILEPQKLVLKVENLWTAEQNMSSLFSFRGRRHDCNVPKVPRGDEQKYGTVFAHDISAVQKHRHELLHVKLSHEKMKINVCVSDLLRTTDESQPTGKLQVSLSCGAVCLHLPAARIPPRR